MAEMTGKSVFQDWETGEAIGHGSFGTVYEIKKQDALGYSERAAMKHISIPQSDSDIEMLQSEGQDEESITETFKEQAREIINEYKLMKKLNDCPNIVSCDDYKAVQHDNDLGWDIFIKMELLTPLVKLLNGQILSEEQIRQLGIDLCNALIYCHNKNIIHRDIKPQNIFISADGIFKLGDFGIARIIMNGSSTGTAKIGTYDYMAPEVYHAQHYGVSADICSLGLVLYWLLNNRRCPFQSTEKQWLKNSEKEEARDRRFAGEAIPAPLNGSEELKRIVLKACAYDPKDRYVSAETMLSELNKLNSPMRYENNVISDNKERRASTHETAGRATLLQSNLDDDETVSALYVADLKKESKLHTEEKDISSEVEDPTVGVFGRREDISKADHSQSITNLKRKKKQKMWIWPIVIAVIAIIGLLLPDIWNTIPEPTSMSVPTFVPTPKLIQATRGEEDWGWSLVDGVLVVNGTGNMKDYGVQEEVPWFATRDQIAQISVREGITGIGNRAFCECHKLTSITIQKSVTSIGEEAFAWCTGLTTVIIPKGVTSVRKRTFKACYSLTSVVIPDSVTSIETQAFDYCRSLTDIYYSGTKEQWAAIEIGEDNDPLFNATIHYNSK